MCRLLRLNPNFKPAFDGLFIAKELLLKLTTQVEVIEAFLFGSAAEGRNTFNSDLDLLVIVNDEETVRLAYKVVTQAFFSEVAVDWIIKTKSEFDKQKDIGGVCMIAFKHGKRII